MYVVSTDGRVSKYSFTKIENKSLRTVPAGHKAGEGQATRDSGDVPFV
jgi:hypothetical protein